METYKGNHGDIILGRETQIKLTHVRDVLYYDYPILSIFRDDDDKMYLMYYLDHNGLYDSTDENDTYFSMWLAWHVEQNYFDAYMIGDITLYELITFYGAKHGYMRQNSGRGELMKTYEVEIAEIPDSYLPEIDSFYDRTLSPEHTKQD